MVTFSRLKSTEVVNKNNVHGVHGATKGAMKNSIGQSPQVELCHKLQKAKNADVLVHLWDSQHIYFNAYNLCTFFNRLYKVANAKGQGIKLTPDHKSKMHEIIKLAVDLIEKFDVDGRRILSNSLRHLKPTDSTLFQALKSELFRYDRAKFEEMDAKGLALLADAAAELEPDPTVFLSAIHDELIRQDELQKQPKLHQCKPEELAYIARAFSFSHEARRELYQVLDMHIREQKLVPHFEPWHLAMLADGIRRRDMDMQALLGQIAAHCLNNPQDTLEKCDGADLGLLKRAMQALHKPPKAVLRLIKEELLKERITKDTNKTPRSLVRIFESYCDLAPGPDTLFQALKEKLYKDGFRAISQLPPTELVLALRGISNATTPDGTLLQKIYSELLKPQNFTRIKTDELVLLAPLVPLPLETLQDNLQEFTPRELGQLGKAFASYNMPSIACINACKDAALIKIDDCTIRDLANIAIACKRLVKEDTKTFYTVLRTKLLLTDPTTIKAFDASYGVQLAQGILHKFENQTELYTWLEKIELKELELHDLAQLVYVYAQADQKNPEFYNRLDLALLDAVSRINELQQQDWEDFLLATWSFGRSGQHQSKSIRLFFRRLENELPKIRQELTVDHTLLQAWRMTEDESLEKFILQAPPAQSNLVFTNRFGELFILLYLTLSDKRPELFSDEIMLLLTEIKRSKCLH